MKPLRKLPQCLNCGMKTPKCPSCGGEMVRNGRTKAGKQRWLCKSCRATATHKIDNAAKLLAAFLAWLLSGKTMAEMPGEGRTFRRKTSGFWDIWALPPVTGEVHRVLFVDGIHIARNIVVLIACTDEHVVGWYLARSECSRSWGALMSKVAPPEIVVTDGGSGFEKARRSWWPDARVQRCVFHAFCQVRRYTTTRPNLPAGAELYGLAKQLLRIGTLKEADAWVSAYLSWGERWDGFLSEKTYDGDGRSWEWTHARLVKARNSLNRLVSGGGLFTYLDPDLASGGALPATNNVIEGGVNAQIRNMLRDHRGLSDMRRVKAVFWWCYMHTEDPLPPAEILRTMPTDADIDLLYREYSGNPAHGGGPAEWGDGLVWAEFHNSDPRPSCWD